MYYDVYIRKMRVHSFEYSANISEGPLDSCYRLKLVRAGAGITVDPTFEDLADGTQSPKSEAVSFTAASLKVSIAELERLKAEFDGELCDVAFISPHAMHLIGAAYALRLYIRVLAESAESAIIQITGKENVGMQSQYRGVRIEDLTAQFDFGLIRGRLLDQSGNPVAGAMVTDQGEDFPVKTAADGEFNFIYPPGEIELYADAQGLTFTPVPISVPDADIVDIGDWVAT